VGDIYLKSLTVTKPVVADIKFSMSAITKYLPKRQLSRFIGKFIHWQGPKWWARSSIRLFAWYYNINLSEAEKSYVDYASIGDFFVRRLKRGVRPVGDGWALHPADSRITQAMPIESGTLIQAKGLTYSLKDFTQDDDCAKKWDEGLFITYYLCPTDYHRVHSPVDGKITNVKLVPGELWPVNDWSTSNIPQLFSVNERVLVEIQTPLGPVGVVFVGATNVGQICLSFDDSVRGNQDEDLSIRYKSYEPAISIKKSDELGMFRMGSTVVMLYPRAFRDKYQNHLNLGPTVKVNASLTEN
jgi:phosphatidylserine decarboxylase